MPLGMTDHLLHGIRWETYFCRSGKDLRMGARLTSLSSRLIGHGAQLIDRQGVVVERRVELCGRS